MGFKNSITDLLFDWDGTLVDSAATGYNAFARTFADLGISFSDEFYNTNYSPNWYSMYEALGLPRGDWQRADELWLEHYRDEPVLMVEDAYATLHAVAERGYRIGVVTSGSQQRVTREVDLLGLSSLFCVVVCNESVVNKKPHPEGLERAIALIKTSPESCSYIGDAPEDIQMGRAAGVMTVGVRSAYPASARLNLTKPDILLDSIGQLLLHF